MQFANLECNAQLTCAIKFIKVMDPNRCANLLLNNVMVYCKGTAVNNIAQTVYVNFQKKFAQTFQMEIVFSNTNSKKSFVSTL